MGQVCRCKVITKEALGTGWGALCIGCLAFSHLDKHRKKVAHKLSGAQSSSTGSRVFLHSGPSQTCSRSHWQHGSGGVHKSPKRHAHDEPADMDRSTSPIYSRFLCPWPSELQCGHAVEHVWVSRGGSLCVSREHSFPTVLIPSGILHSGNGCTRSSLAGSMQIHVLKSIRLGST